jgi:putative flippase GtrA
MAIKPFIENVIKTHQDTFLRFLVVGGAATLLNLSIVYTLYHYASVHYALAFAIGYMTGVVFAFTFSKVFAFRSRSKKYAREGGAFFLVYGITLCIGLGIVTLLVHFGLPPMLASVLSIGCTTLLNYLGSKYVAFRHALKDKS